MSAKKDKEIVVPWSVPISIVSILISLSSIFHWWR
jgi:hypothetical protein